jgi:hypothetical protein
MQQQQSTSERTCRQASSTSSTVPSKRLSTGRQNHVHHRPSTTTTVSQAATPQETFRRRPSLPNQPCLEEGEVLPVYKASQGVKQNHYPSPENNQDEEMTLAHHNTHCSPPEASYQVMNSKARLTRHTSVAYGRHQSMPPPSSQGQSHYLHHHQHHHMPTKTHHLQHQPHHAFGVESRGGPTSSSSIGARNGWTDSDRAMC